MFRPMYLEVKLRHDELLREARKQRLAASITKPESRSGRFAAAFSLRLADARQAF